MLPLVPRDAQRGLEPRQCPFTEDSGIHEMEYIAASTGMRAPSGLTRKHAQERVQAPHQSSHGHIWARERGRKGIYASV